MARMLGGYGRDFCPYHRSRGYGMDCPSTACSKRIARKREKRQWRREITDP